MSTKIVAPPTFTSTGKDVKRPISYDAVDGTISVLRFDSLPIISIACSTLSSSVPQINVVLPASRKPPVVANLVL